ncbi:MAG: polysaccharide biosynthesis/export family protein [Acidobacteria bacterium]|nr:polysaccharide biosynthesis/export family protein [Acidobacteriota bacterium]
MLLKCFVLAAASSGWLWGQAAKPDARTADPPKTTLEEAAKGVGAAVDPKTYKIGPEDILLVRVWREPELSGPLAVRPDGRITLPLVGELMAAGLTPEQLTASISTVLAKFINRPEVLVSVQAVNSKKFMVSGEVNRPGAYPLVTPVTVLEAIVQAGGVREFANKKKIVIMRGAERLKFNYNDVIKGKNLAQNVQIEHGDHIVVP